MKPSELERIYDTHAAGLFRYLWGFTHQEADARDLLQEVFIKLARNGLGAKVREERAYLYRLTHNLAVDWMRRAQARRDAVGRMLREPGGASGSLLHEDRGLVDDALAAAMDALPDDQRSVVHLKLVEGLTFEEISRAQGIPLNTAASRYRYALDKLRSCLRPLYKELS